MKRRHFLATPLLAVPLLARASGAMYAFGDSVTRGVGASNLSLGYAALLATALGRTLENQAVTSEQLQDTAARIYGVALPSDALSVWLAGFNDLRFYGNSAEGQATYAAGVEALAAWLAIPDVAKVRPTGWAPSPYFFGKTSSARGDSLTAQVAGNVVYVAGTLAAGGGRFAVKVDGKAEAVGNCAGVAVPFSGKAYAPFLVRVCGLRPTTHTVTVTVESGPVFVDWIAGNVATIPAYVGSGLRCTQAGYTYPRDALGMTAWNEGTDALARKYARLTREACERLRRDGLDVTFVDVDRFFDPVRDTTPPDIHPNDGGHERLKNAFLSEM